MKETVARHKTHTEHELHGLRSLLVQHINNGPPGTVPPPPPGSAAVDTLHSEIESVNASVMKELRSVQHQIDEKLDTINNNGVLMREDLISLSRSIGGNYSVEESGEYNMSTELQAIGGMMRQNFDLQLKNTYGYITALPEYTCKETEGWRLVVNCNMSVESTCPTGWKLVQNPKVGCGRVSNSDSPTCDSVVFRVKGAPYAKVCGRINAYQVGATDAFEAFDEGRATSIDEPYVSGISITHGNPRKHVWTFAAGIRETYHDRNDACPCDATIPISIPPFVGNDYFCESGFNTASDDENECDILWDGEDCSATSTCCSFNNPPYFCKQLPHPTCDDIEVRICHRDADEDTPIVLIELYVK